MMEPGPNDIVKETTLEEMCIYIFSKPPTQPMTNVIQLQPESDQHILPSQEGSYIFEILQNILFNGIATAFPDYVDSDGKKYLNLSKLTLEDCEELKKYMRSMGYDICIDMIPLSQEEIELSKIDPQQAVKKIFSKNIDNNESVDSDYESEESNYESEESNILIKERSCKCGWELTKGGSNKHFSDYYTHFIRTDNLGISLHFLQYRY